MNKRQLIDYVKKAGMRECELWYINHGVSKHDQDNLTGVQCVAMNVELLSAFIEYNEGDESFDSLPKASRREVWEASFFHFGIMGYDPDDADHYWKKARD